jgi:hypothetical protein
LFFVVPPCFSSSLSLSLVSRPSLLSFIFPLPCSPIFF